MSIKILSWNILHPDFIDCKFKPIDYSHRLPIIINNLLSHDPAIICLQEADSATIESDFAIFTEYTLIYQNDKSRQNRLNKWRENIDSNMKKPNTIVCAFLVKKNCFIIHPEIIIGSRSLTIHLSWQDLKFTISNVHLESGKCKDAIHIKHLSKLLNSDIICGDFNDWLDEPFIDYLNEKGFIRAPIKGYTYKHDGFQSLIDHFFFKPQKLCLHSSKVLHFDGITRDYPSDHAIIVVDLTLTIP